MYQPTALFIGLRYIYRHTIDYFTYFISWLSIFGVTIGIMALVIMFSVMNGFEQELQDSVLKLIPQAILLSTTNKSLNPQQFSNEKIKLHGVMHVTPLTIGNVLLQSSYGITLGVMLGIDPIYKDPLTPYLINVEQTNLISNKYNVILGKNLAKYLNVNYGDRLRVIVPSVNQFTLVGYLPSQRLFNVIGVFASNNEVDNYQILVNIQDASNLMQYKTGNITGWRLWLKKPLKVDKYSQQKLPNGTIWKDWRESKGELFQAMRMEKNIIGLLLSLIVIISIFNIISSLSVITIEKKADIAILKTQGMTSYQVMTIFIIQGIFISSIGILFGSIFGVLLTNQLNNLMQMVGLLSNNVTLPIVIKLPQIANIALITTLITLLSIFYPSWHAGMIQPIRVLRYE